jgi:hypothetical protein
VDADRGCREDGLRTELSIILAPSNDALGGPVVCDRLLESPVAARLAVNVMRQTARDELPDGSDSADIGPHPWARVEDIDGDPEPLDSFRFFGVLGTWNEEDIVEACVRNALTQGCEQVFVVDNESDDGTVSCAVAAGAVLARTYATDGFDEALRMQLMQEVVDSVSFQSGASHVWWLWLDADEFPRGRLNLTLRQQLELLDRRYRVVGGRVLNHYPSAPPHYLPGDDPLDHQPLAEEIVEPHCDLVHRKHSLQRWDAAGPQLTSGLGFHTASASVQLIEPPEAILIHHFPFRQEPVTRGRLRKMCEGSGPAEGTRAVDEMVCQHIWARYRSLDAVYRQDWDQVIDFVSGNKGVKLRHWTELVEPRPLIDELERSAVGLRRQLVFREAEVAALARAVQESGALSTQLAAARAELARIQQSVTVRLVRRMSNGLYGLIGRTSLLGRAIQGSLRMVGRIFIRESNS